MVIIDEKKSAFYAKPRYQLWGGLKLNYNNQDELVAWIESFINDIRKLEKTLDVESKIKNLEKDFE